MDDSELRSILNTEIDHSISYYTGDLSKQREKALQYYLGEPFGNEVDGRSKVVTSDVSETVEWILPSLMRIFTGGEQTVKFEPTQAADEAAAKQATEYCNWVLTRDNPGFIILYTMFKDALLQKNGIVKIGWEEREDPAVYEAENVDQETFMLAMQDPDIEIVSMEEIPGDPSEAPTMPAVMSGPSPPNMPGMMNGQPPQMQGAPPPPPLKINYRWRRKPVGRIGIWNVPPEEFLIDNQAKDIPTARFVGHRTKRRVTDLRAEGYEISDEEARSSEHASDMAEWESEAVARRNYDGSDNFDPNVEKETQEVWVIECYRLLDWDGDGIAERRRILCLGRGFKILENEAWDGPPCFVSVTPIVMPHRFFGLSVAELVMDIQLVKSTILRQILDNMYLANNVRHVISDSVEIDDMLISRPGGNVRLKNGALPSQGHIMPLETRMFVGQAFPMIEYFDMARENRTGVTRYNQGMHADSLNKTASGISQIMGASQARIELIARIFAETGLKDLFRTIVKFAAKYQNKPRIIRLRDQWVPMDPRQWEHEFDMSATVGIGMGDKKEQAAMLQMMIGMQLKAVELQGGIQGPAVTWENMYNSLSRLVEAAGLKEASLYFTPPGTPMPQQQPRPDPKMIEVQQKGQIEQQKLALESKKAEAAAANDMRKLQLEREVADAEIRLKAMEAEANIALQREKANSDIGLQREKTAADMSLKRDVATQKAQPAVALSLNGQEVGNMAEGLSALIAGIAQQQTAFMQRQADRDAKQDDMTRALLLAISAPKQIAATLPSGGKFSGTINTMGNA